jgi:hypothetical protein
VTPPQDHLPDPIGVRFGVGQGQGAAPRSAEDQPTVDVQVFAKQLDVRDEVLGSVAGQIDVGLACVRRAPSAAALIEQHDAIRDRIEQPAVPPRASRPRATVDHNRRLAARVAARLPVHSVAVTDLQHSVLVWLDLWMHIRHLASELPEQLTRWIEEPAGRTSVGVPVVRDPPHPAIHPVPVVAVPRRGDALEVFEQPGLYLGAGVSVDPPHHQWGRAHETVGHPALIVLEMPSRHLLRLAQEAFVFTH